jgi:integrase
MPKKRAEKKHRGLFERPPGSGIWWINFYVDGKQHREKAGTKQAAINLYQKRKQDDREGKKLPSLRSTRFVTLSELIDDALEHVAGHKDLRNYKSKAEIVRADLGGRKAEDITPQELLQWLNGRKKSAATYNRYKAFLSLCYRVGEQNSKVEKNPARKAPHKREDNARIRFLSQEDEYPRLHASVSELFPEHVAEFVVSVHSGMRLSEQYTAEWSQYQKDRRAIELSKTKNGHQRTVHLNQDAIDAIESLKLPGQRMRGRIFPREGSKDRFDNRSWFVPCLEAARIDVYLWHCNRHTFCSWLAMAGASTKEIQEAAGHRTITMAARYAHLSPAHRLSVVERIAGKLSGNQHAPVHAPAAKHVTVKERN